MYSARVRWQDERAHITNALTQEVRVTFTSSTTISYGDIHKPRGQLRGWGVSQMTILLHKPYLVKVSKNTQKFDHVVYG